MSKVIYHNKESITNELGGNPKKTGRIQLNMLAASTKTKERNLSQDQKLVIEMKKKMHKSNIFEKSNKPDIKPQTSNVRLIVIYLI